MAVLTIDRCSPSTETDFRLARESREKLADLAKDYRIGGGDVLEVSIFELEKRDEFKTLDIRIEESGNITIPLTGLLHAGGLTVSELETKITDALIEGEFIKAPRVSIIVKEYQSKKISVLGAVTKPGEYMIRRNATSLLDALGMAGGPTEEAGYEIYIIRAEQKEVKIAVDLIALMEEGNLDLNVVLGHGDAVYLPKAKRIYVVGFVRKPGGFPLYHPMTVLEGIAMAEGLMEQKASPRCCALKRLNNGVEEIIPLDLVEIALGRDRNFFLQPNDVIDIRQTTTRLVTLELLDFFKGIFHFGYDLNPRRYD
jgi:polysaccharide biosynthesis/export protein